MLSWDAAEIDGTMHAKGSWVISFTSISKSLLSQLDIHIILAKQEKIVSNSLAKQFGINSNLANLPSARANIRAYTAWHPGLFVRLAGFFILPSKKCQTLGDGLFFYLAYSFTKSQDLPSKI